MDKNVRSGKKALIIGATGLVGRYCLNGLLEASQYSEVIALVRKPCELDHPKLRVVLTDFQNISDLLSTVEVDDLFCCLGTTIKKAGSRENFRKIDFELVVNIAEIMRQLGAQQFLVISAMGANKESKIFYNQVKGEMEEAVQMLRYPCLRIIRPSLLLGPREEFRLGEKIGVILTPLLKHILIGGMKKYRPVEAQSVADFMVMIAGEMPDAGIHIYESDML
ncbi:MAG: hypothetical protein ACI8PB_005196 [Desulforhopalus sp.]|jgi:uncharacterized protein YbjT (DUF2867 family)